MSKRLLVKLFSCLTAISVLGSVMPAVYGMDKASAQEDGDEYILSTNPAIYSENFEDPDIKTIMQNQQNGWTIEGEKWAIDTGTGFNTGSNAVRFSSVDWGANTSLTLDLAENAASKEIDAATFDEATSGRTAVSLQYGMDADFGGFWNGSQNRLEFQDKSGNTFMALEVYTRDNGADDITLNLIALNDSKDQNIRYELAKGRDNIFKLIKTLTIYLDPETNTYQVNHNGDVLSIGSHGEWIPASTSGDVGPANQSSSLSLGSIKINNIGSNWYGGIILDTLSISTWNMLTFTGAAEAPTEPMTMWYRMPAQSWSESLPLGNGRIGAMIWGDVSTDTVSLSEVTAWSGAEAEGLDADNTGSDGQALIQMIQDELMKDSPDYNLLQSYLSMWGGESNSMFGTNRPFGKLSFNHEVSGDEIQNYKRALDLRTAVSTVNYDMDGTSYSREAFLSNPAQVLVMKYSADDAGSITFDVNFETEEINGGTGTVIAGADYLEWDGAVHNNSNVTNGVKTFGYLKAINTGGSVAYDENGLHVDGADEVVLILSIGTDFTAGENFVQNTKENCKSQLDAAAARSYDELKSEHINDVQPFFDRMKVEIGPDDELLSQDPTDVRFEKIRNGAEIDGSFMSLWYQYARYLMIAGSRENSPLPMNLQGMWNDNVAANMAWTNDYHLDINIEMNQWMSTSANLTESEIPIFNFLKNILIPNGKITAAKQYATTGDEEIGIGTGWVSSITTNGFGYTGNTGEVGAWHGNTTCGAWLVQEVMNYFDATWDIDFLRDTGFQILKDTADFYLNYMIQYTDDDGNTYWVTAPSSSPEHGNIEMMSTMEITIINDIFEQVLRCYDILGMDHDAYYNAVAEKKAGIYPYKIQSTGNLAEWPFNPSDDGNTNHRHTSHLLGLFPYDDITPDKTPELAHAALISMQRRFDRSDFEHTEWTAVNAQGMYARLKDGEKAYEYLKLQGDTFTWPNLLSISPEGIALAPTDVYIIDGTFGVGEATADMLLQTHSDRIEFLPALPRQWAEGDIEGMTGPGAFEVDFSWDDYTLKSAKILSKAGNTVNIYKNAAANWQDVGVFKQDGDGLTPVTVTETSTLITFDTEANAEYVLLKKNGSPLTTGRIINDNDSRIQYNGFSSNGARGADKNDYNDDVHFSDTAGSTIEFTFTGTGIDVLAETDTGRGTFEVYIDNESKGIYDSIGESYTGQDIVYSSEELPYGQHTIRIEKRDSGSYLEFDAFAVKGQYFTYVNDDNPIITYEGSGWQRHTGREANDNGQAFNDYMGDIRLSTQAGDSLTVEFNGTGIEILAELNNVNGDIALELDGVDMGTVSTGDSNIGHSAGNSNIWQSSTLPNGTHTLKITNTGTGGQGWGWVEIDGFIVLNEGGTAFNPGTYKFTNMNTGATLDANESGLYETSQLTGGATQKWIVDYDDDRYFRLISAYSGMAVTINDGDQAVMAPVDVYNENQLFELAPYSGDASAYMLMSKTKGLYMQANGGPPVGNGWSLGLYQADDYQISEHFIWYVEDDGNGLTKFRLNNTTKYMTIESTAPAAAGTRLVMWDALTDVQQMWNVSVNSDGTYSISSVRNGGVIVDQDGTAALAEPGAGAEKWNIESARRNGVTYYSFVNAETGNELSFGGNTMWQTSANTESGIAPYVYDIDLESNVITNGQPAVISYNYGSLLGEAEEGTTWEAYIIDNGSPLENPVASGTASEETGITFDVTGMAAGKQIAVKIAPKSAENQGVEFIKIFDVDVKPADYLIGNVTTTEDFSREGLAGIISSGGEGWYSSGNAYAISIEDKGKYTDSLKFNSTDWWNTSELGVKLDNESNSYEPLSGQGYVEFDVMFDAPSYYDINNKMYVALKSGSQRFAAVRLNGNSLELVGMGDYGDYAKAYSIARGMENTYSKWFNFKFYVDTTANQYAVKVNDAFILSDDGDIWFRPAAEAIDLNETDPITIGSVTDIAIGHKWSGSNASVYIDNLKLGTYSAGEADRWTINSLDTKTGELLFGQENEVYVNVYNANGTEDGQIFVGLYDDNDVLIDSENITDVTFDDRGIFETAVKLDVPRKGGDYKLKAFVWTDNMQPIGKEFVTEKTVESAFNLPNVFSENMMFQADEPINVWGSAIAGDEITVELKDQESGASVSSTAAAEDDGTWQVELAAQKAGGNYTMTVTCGEEVKTYGNIIMGDVYILGGQSNMEYWMSGLADTNEDLNNNPDRAENPNIRTIDLLSKGTNGSEEPSENVPDVDGTVWKEMSFSVARNASQIGYYFAQQLNEETGRPIGLISTAVGGTAIDRWEVGGNLFNNRIYPCRNFAISGVLFYQGEANEYMPASEYSDRMAGLIDGYRELFGDEDLPFWYAQLARYGNQNFENIRAAQVWTLDKVANQDNVGIVSTLDEVGSYNQGSGNARNDIHPYGKAIIAERFAQYAKSDVYGGVDYARGPLYQSMAANGSTIELTFDCTGDLQIMPLEQYADYQTQILVNTMVLDPNILNGFEIAGEDGVYYTATAEIQGNKVILSADEVSAPVKARYAFGAYPESPNLTDSTGLPSYTFATEYTTK